MSSPARSTRSTSSRHSDRSVTPTRSPVQTDPTATLSRSSTKGTPSRRNPSARSDAATTPTTRAVRETTDTPSKRSKKGTPSRVSPSAKTDTGSTRTTRTNPSPSARSNGTTTPTSKRNPAPSNDQRTPTSRRSPSARSNGFTTPTTRVRVATPRSKTSTHRSQRAVSRQSDIEEEVDINLPQSPGDVLSPARSQRGGFIDFDMGLSMNYGTPSSISSSTLTGRSVARGTPVRIRSDIGSERRVRQIDVGPDELLESQETIPDQGPQLVIWGTNVNINQCKETFKRFILRFVNQDLDEDERMEEDTSDSEPLYLQKLDEIYTLEERFINVNCLHLNAFNEDLYRQLICYPQEVIPTFDMVFGEIYNEKYPGSMLDRPIETRPFNAKKTKNMRALNPEDIDQLITISGMVIRTSNLIPEMREAYFRCNVCSFSTTIMIDRGRIIEPSTCINCNTNHTFTMIHNRSHFTDKQLVKLQESPDDMPPGQTPHTVVVFAHGDLVDSVQPGDRVTVTGIYRAMPMRINPRLRNVKSVYKTHVDVIHFRKVDTKRLREDGDGKDARFNPERILLLKELSKKEDIYERLARAIAPSIYEHEDIKKGILLQLFCGTKKDFSESGKGNFRAEINILLCGDPGTSKSQLLQYIFNLVPRSQYTSGKGSSAVGLTAYVMKDPETRQLVLQTGALVLSDNGICCIDEFDKMNDSTRSVLHEVMEQQTLSIAKAGIICQLNARTSILAAANPVESQWNKNKTIVENIQLPHTLMSRFDLIFLMLDPQDAEYDRKLARHLVSLYYRSEEEEQEEMLDMTILRDYIAYAREHVHPKLSDEASQRLISVYVNMRKVGSGKGQITAYPRQLESLIRLAEAHAKIRFSEVVEITDVEEGWRLHREALKQSATDPMSGKIDVTILTTGLSSAGRKRRIELAKALKTLIESKGKVATLPYQKTFFEIKEGSHLMITREMFEDAVRDLQEEGLLTLAGRTTIRLTHKRTI